MVRYLKKGLKMTTGEKISIQRKQNNYTQEQLADILGVTRQTVSKWETDLAFPETDKLIKMSDLFKCTLDYLLKEGITDSKSTSPDQPKPSQAAAPINGYVQGIYYEYKSKRTLWGLPLVHINWGLHRTARGVIAIGVKAQGIIAIGIFPIGIIALGVLSIGIFAFGAFAFGLLDFASVAIGYFSFGAISIGIMSNGAVSVGQFAFGAASYGHYLAVGDQAYGLVTCGKTVSAGTYYAENSQNITEAVKQALAKVVPSGWSWLKDLFLRLYS
jgi:transcriptional regulator with XRE-family HTH domain